ncbi:hypothetical protein P7C70_g600, partial [Phenoliferia sp. Uapishka_3]
MLFPFLRKIRSILNPRRVTYSSLDTDDATRAFKEGFYPSPAHQTGYLVQGLVLHSLLAFSFFTTAILTFVLLAARPPPPQVETPGSSQRILIRSTEDNGAGIGAALKQLTRSVVLAEALDAEVFAVESFTSMEHLNPANHGYDTIGLVNSKRKSVLANVDFSRVCKVSNYLFQDEYIELTDAVCDGFPSVIQRSIIYKLKNCSVILQDLPWEVSPRLTKCTWKWLSGVFENPQAKVVEAATNVALHIRWGDMAEDFFGNDKRTADRSIPIPVANSVISGLKKCLGPLSLTVYMENHNDTVLADLNHPFTVVDTPSPIDDLVELMKHEVLVVAGGGYTQAAHQVCRGGLTVVPDWEEHQERYWFDVGTNSVMPWEELVEHAANDCSIVKKAFEVGKERSKAYALELLDPKKKATSLVPPERKVVFKPRPPSALASVRKVRRPVGDRPRLGKAEKGQQP